MAEVIIVPTQADAAQIVAEHIAHQVRRKPDLVLGVATGSTPLPVYAALAERRASGVDFSRVTAFALDEYVGLPVDHPESYHAVIHREVTEPLGLDPERVYVPDGSLEGLETAGERYEAAIEAAGGVDIQIVGIGASGHIGFNEPGSGFASRTRVKTLVQQTRLDNARFFDSVDDVPIHCVTQGLGTIMRARHVVLLAFGAGKADIVAQALEGPMTASVPASVLQGHSHVTAVLDEQAASSLRFDDYYRHAFENKPIWQGL